MRDVPSNITELSLAWGMNFLGLYQAGGSSSTEVLSDSEKSLVTNGILLIVFLLNMFSEMIIVFNREIAV